MLHHLLVHALPFTINGTLDSLHFVLADLSAPLIEEWRHAFTQHLPENLRGNISIIHSKLADLTPPVNQVDCIVSPANSYGRLDGG